MKGKGHGPDRKEEILLDVLGRFLSYHARCLRVLSNILKLEKERIGRYERISTDYAKRAVLVVDQLEDIGGKERSPDSQSTSVVRNVTPLWVGSSQLT